MKHNSHYDFDSSPERTGTSSDKWAMYEERGILPFWLADMDFKSPPEIVEALHKRIEHGIFGYTSASSELVCVILETLDRSYGWKVDPDWLVWLPGLVSGINVACRSVGGDGDDVITLIPVYPPFLTAPQRSRRNLIKVLLLQDHNRWQIDFDLLEQAVSSRSRLFLLCNPHNPVGRCYTRGELTTLADLCIRHDMVICSDEIHCGLILDEDKHHIPTATLSPEIADRTITLMAASKTFNIPGLGCGFAIISNEKLRWEFRAAMTGIVPHVNLLGYTATLAGYRDAGDWHAALLDYLRSNRELVRRKINGMNGLSTSHVEATYLAWIDTRGTGIKNPVRFFENANVGLGNGVGFGYPGFLRMTFGCPRAMLEEGLNRMEEALQEARMR
jgi:cystathionine beta-lyase